MNFSELEVRENTAPVRKMYTGFAPIQIVAVNPNTKELAELLGIDPTKVKEPVYVNQEKDNLRLDFWYVNHPAFKTEFRGKFSLWVDSRSRVAKSGKKQYIDDFTKIAWAENLAMLSEAQNQLAAERRIDMRSIREAKGGEETLYSLMKAYGNISTKAKPMVLNSWDKIAKGDVRELREFFDHFNKSDGGVKVLMGIRDGQYQDVYTNLFLNAYGKITDYVSKNVRGEYGFKSFFNDDFTFAEYNPELAPAMNEIDANSPIVMFNDAPNPFASNDPTPGINSDANFDKVF